MFLLTFAQGMNLKSCPPAQRDKIDFLRSNQHLGIEPITSEIKPNCWGTTVHLADGEEFVADAWLEYLERGTYDINDQVCLPLDCSRPGYVGRWPMIRFLQERTTPAEKKRCKGGIVAFYAPTSLFEEEKMRIIYGEKVLLHTGIYLGSLCGDMMFHQDRFGGRFEFASIRGFAYEFWQRHSCMPSIDYHTLK